MQTQTTIKLISAALLSLLISACGGGDSSQLDNYESSSSTSSAGGGSSASSSIDTTTAQKIGFGSGESFVEGTIGVSTGTEEIPAGGTTQLTVNIVSDTNSLVTGNITVTFNSACVARSEATFGTGTGSTTNVVTTSNGQASIIYKAAGCEGEDTITASAGLSDGTQTAQVTISVAPDEVQTVKYISASPDKIFLKGTGSDETSTVTFQILGSTGAPIKNRDVTFTLSNPIGGAQLTTLTGTTNNTGHVSTVVQSGTSPGSVEVTATADGISGKSNSLIISTGLPDQNSVSISASLFNPSGWNHDGEVSNITIRLADENNNPAPDDTAVYFTAEGGAIDSSCRTENGGCTVKWRSQDFRPTDGRVTILATTQGNESFIDLDGDGLYDPTKDAFANTANGGNCSLNVPRASESPADPVNNPTPCDDLGEAYVDRNENGQYDAGEQITDQDLNGVYTAPNGIYNGSRCKTEGVGCTKQSVSIREHLVLVMSSDRSLTDEDTGLLIGQPESVQLGAGQSISFTVLLADIHGNAMPAGTTISLNTTGVSDATVSHTMPNSGVANTTSPTMFSVTVKASDNKAPSGTFTIQVKSPYLEVAYPTSISAPVAPPAAAIGTGSGGSFNEGAIATTIGNNTLAAGGSTTLSVNVVDEDNALVSTPTAISFSSPCIDAGTAKLFSGNTETDTVFSVAGTASITYTAFGCVGDDLITATPSNPELNTATTTINVAPVSVQSITFISTSTEQISLKGTGGNETAVVTFRVIGAEAQAVAGVTVNLSLNSTAGGLCLTTSTGCAASTTAISNASGNVTTTVQAGSIPTSVRVTATTGSISTQSSRLVVSTGIPDQDSMSLSASLLVVPEAWHTDGIESDITIRMADAFNNPPPDGTAVTFTAEGGSIDSDCVTSGGSCTVTWRSQSPRPSNGRVTIRATALGNESFIDSNGNGYFDNGDIFNTNVETYTDANDNDQYDLGETYVDADGNGVYSNGESCQANAPRSTISVDNDPLAAPCDDLVEAYLDSNENGQRDTNEPLVDYNEDASHTTQNGIYNGFLCLTEGAGCTKEGVTVRDDLILVMGNRDIYTDSITNLLDGQPENIILGAGQTTTFTIELKDIKGNGLPAGSSIDIDTADADNVTITHNLPSGGVDGTVNPTTVVVRLRADPVLAPTGLFTIEVTNSGSTTNYTTTINQ